MLTPSPAASLLPIDPGARIALDYAMLTIAKYMLRAANSNATDRGFRPRSLRPAGAK